MLLSGRRILVGVCGGIAAYKACELVRQLMREGAEVQVVLTPTAAKFISPLTFAALTERPAPVDEFAVDPQSGADVYPHLELTRDIDCYVIVPATANMIAKLAAGLGDNLASAAALSCEAPLVVAPAMNYRMWQNAAVQENLQTLRRRGHLIVMPESGELACGDRGVGRLADLPEIFALIVQATSESAVGTAPDELPIDADRPPVAGGDLSGRRIIVTAGGTREYLDPVRFITNASTGRLGLGLVSELARRGARVELLDTGIDVDIAVEGQLADREIVRTAYDLQAALARRMPRADALVMLAAVADYAPSSYRNSKHKKDGSPWIVELAETPDVLASIAAARKPGQLLVGVSLEDTDWLARGMKKVATKGVDLIVAVELGADPPFGEERLQCALVDAQRVIVPAARRAKAEVATLLGDWLAARLAQLPSASAVTT
jgi:phosphopantothenoylcysteine decarboxylase/phosphopantothenate--cysteine ligase